MNSYSANLKHVHSAVLKRSGLTKNTEDIWSYKVHSGESAAAAPKKVQLFDSFIQ